MQEPPIHDLVAAKTRGGRRTRDLRAVMTVAPVAMGVLLAAEADVTASQLRTGLVDHVGAGDVCTGCVDHYPTRQALCPPSTATCAHVRYAFCELDISQRRLDTRRAGRQFYAAEVLTLFEEALPRAVVANQDGAP